MQQITKSKAINLPLYDIFSKDLNTLIYREMLVVYFTKNMNQHVFNEEIKSYDLHTINYKKSINARPIVL